MSYSINLLSIERDIASNKEKFKEVEESYSKKIMQLEMERKNLYRLKKIAMSDLSLAKILIAENILYFGYGFKYLDLESIKRAINDIVTGENKLKTEYFGIKNYEHFIGQGVQHRYYMGPKHGHITFSVGLKPKYREIDLSDIEIDAVIYYLNLIVENKKFREEILK